jgi:hypothetical protein
VVLDPRLPALGGERRSPDFLAEGRVLLAAVVAKNEARVARLGLEGADVGHANGAFHAPGVPGPIVRDTPLGSAP